MSEDKSLAYFDSRPEGSRIGAAVSLKQSEVIAGRHVLDDRERHLKEQIAKGEALKKPDYWGGYTVVPDSFEFWQGQTTRIHDRLRFRKWDGGELSEGATKGADGWIIERLSP